MVSGSLILEDLQSGQHSLTVFGRYELYSMPGRIGFDNQTIQFTINKDNSIVTSNPGNGGGVSEFKLSIITVCVFVSVFLLIIVVAFVLFTKHRSKDVSENTSNMQSVS